MNGLTTKEAALLHEMEETIKAKKSAFMQVAEALTVIHDQKLYRTTHSTFKDYCQKRWGFAKSWSYDMVNYSKVKKKLENVHPVDTASKPDSQPVTEVVPETPRQTRPLAALSEKTIKKAWDKAVEKADGGQPTVKQVEDSVAEVTHTKKLPNPVIDEDPFEQYQQVRGEYIPAAKVRDWWENRKKTLAYAPLHAGDIEHILGMAE